MSAQLYVSPRCVLCKPLVKALRPWFSKRGLTLDVLKEASPVGLVPALVIADVTLVGFEMLAALMALEVK